MQGWITLHRKIDENELWLSEPFTRGQAWVDLLLIANHKPQLLYKRNIPITIERGQVGWSQDKIAKRWRWGRKKVASFLKTLENAQQIKVDNNRTLSRIIIVNYDKYQQKEQQSHNSRTTDRTNNNNVNNDNNTNPQSGEKLKANQSVNMAGFNKYGDDYEFDPIQIDPEHKAKKAKKSGKASEDQLAVFELFNNPAKGLWRMREIEREAAQILFDTYGLETLKRRLGRIESEKQKKDPFLPQVDTPSELLDKMPKVERYLNI